MDSADDTTLTTSDNSEDHSQTTTESPVLVGTSTPGGRVTIEQYAETVYQRIELGEGADVLVCEFSEQRATEMAAKLPGVSYVEANGKYRVADQVPTLSPPDSNADTGANYDQWARERINAQSIPRSSQHQTPRVAVLDTEINSTHEALEVSEQLELVQCQGDETPWPDNRGHGTQVAGLINASNSDEGIQGVHPDASLYAVQVLDENGRGSFSTVTAGICAAVDRDVDVIVLGFGGSQRSLAVRDACRYAAANDTLVVAAAGNSGPLENSVGYPAAFDSVLAVSAIDQNDDIASFSSRGGSVELAAPGVDVLSTTADGKFARLQGTSMAAPHVAGVAAVIMSHGLSAESARQILAETADTIGIDRDRQGNGVVDFEAALSAVPDKTIVKTIDATVDVTGEMAEFEGYVLSPDDIDEATVWFDWKQSSNTTWQSTQVQQIESGGSFATTVDELQYNRQYDFRARATFDDETRTGAVVSFTTGDRVVVETAASTVLGPSAVTLRGRLRHHQGDEVAKVWFQYRERGTNEWQESDASRISRPRFACRLDELKPNAEYEYRARAALGKAVNVGTVSRFETSED